ncbi:MAG TPA: hypothetical protein VJV96_17830 [Candidatus Angelobacter sp.]|nr:hypothetical protein [Candidatus Angelobacter sp.]
MSYRSAATTTESLRSDTEHKGLNALEDVPDFSLVLGGPLYQLLRRSHLGGDAMELLNRRILASLIITWLPLLVLSIFARSTERVSFFHDIEVHARFLAALPILIAAELLVHSRMRTIVRRFVEWRIVLPEDIPAFRNSVQSAIRIRNSVAVEIALLAVVYTVGMLVWNSRSEFGFVTWYALPGSRWNLTMAGYWYVFVSLPLFQFVLLRWYMRLFIWFRFLWQVNRIDLNLIPTHPDRCGGLSFIGKGSYAYAPILFAQSAILAGIIAGRLLYRGESLLSFKFQIGGFIVFFLLVVLGPLLMFAPRMARVRRKGLADYGLFAQRYVEHFDRKWIRGSSPSEEVLGAADIQSLADLGNSYEIVREMRVIPFGLQDVSRLVLAAAAPLSPLLLTIFSFEELALRVIKVVF